MSYKFKAGQIVTFSSAAPSGADRHIKFRILRLLPMERGINQYRLKAVTDGHERVAQESELS